MSAEGVAMTDVSKELLPCQHLRHLPSGRCLGCGEQHQPLPDYQPGDDEAYLQNIEPDARPNSRREWAELIASQLETDAVDAIEEGVCRGEMLTRTPAPSDVVERVARAIANARWLRMGDENYDCWPDHPHLHEDWKREARAAISAMGVSDEVVRLREAAKHLADEMDGLLPYLASHNWRLDRLHDAVSGVRQALAQSDSGDTQ